MKDAMRQGQNKRSRGRSRGKSSNPLSRSYESNGPDVKIRGTAAHIADKYVQLARDAQSSGDPVMAESYFQHAEHYYRLLAAAQPPFQGYPGFVRADQDDLDGEEDDFDGAPGGEDGPMPIGATQPAAPYAREQSQGEPRGERRFEERGERRDEQRRFDERGAEFQRRERPDDRDRGEPRYSRREPRYEPPAGEGEVHEGLPAFITGGGVTNGGEERRDDAERGENGTRYGGRGRRRRYGRYSRDGEAPAANGADAPRESAEPASAADYSAPDTAPGE
jgi:hypothetical protein